MSFLGELWLPEDQPRRKQLDVVPLCRRVLLGWMRHTQTSLNPEDFAEALEYLVTTSWQLSKRWDPVRGVAFDSYLYGILSRRANDWLRLDEGRTKWTWSTHVYERARTVAPLSLDAPAGEDARSLGDLVAAPVGDDPSDREEIFRWLERTADSERARDLRVLREWLCEANAGRVGNPIEEAA